MWPRLTVSRIFSRDLRKLLKYSQEKFLFYKQLGSRQLASKVLSITEIIKQNFVFLPRV